MTIWQTIRRPPWRTIVIGSGVLLAFWAGYTLWFSGLDVRDGRHDRGQNGIWISHGWFADDGWFIRNGKTNQMNGFRNQERIRELAVLLRDHHVTDVFPHVCPAEVDGRLPGVNAEQVERILDAFSGFRVMPWVGGPNGSHVRAGKQNWRLRFKEAVAELLAAHPRLGGVHLNVEPLTSGDTNFLVLLEELRSTLPKDKLISVAAYPPPTRWHPFEDVHWDESYFREVARRSDQMVVMMYDTALRVPRFYQRLMADWTADVLSWSEGKTVLLGVPTYDDIGVEYHFPTVENLTNAVKGIHRGLGRGPLPANYQGLAIYCEWETDRDEWEFFRQHFLKP